MPSTILSSYMAVEPAAQPHIAWPLTYCMLSAILPITWPWSYRPLSNQITWLMSSVMLSSAWPSCPLHNQIAWPSSPLRWYQFAWLLPAAILLIHMADAFYGVIYCMAYSPLHIQHRMADALCNWISLRSIWHIWSIWSIWSIGLFGLLDLLDLYQFD